MPTTPALPSDFTPPNDGLDQAMTLIRNSYKNMRTGRIAPKQSLAQTIAAINAVDFSKPVGTEAALSEAVALMEAGDLNSASARCFGYFNPTSAWPGVLADVLAAARNSQLAVTSHGSASVTMERAVMKIVCENLGIAGGTGHFTSGGSEANETALLAALCRAHPGYIEHGVRAFEHNPSLYVSADSHLAWIKIAKSAGLGTHAVKLVPTSGDGRINIDALDAQIKADKVSGWHPFMIAATCGTTSAGMIDPLAACHEIAVREDLHYHIDAAWAGGLIFDNKRRHLLAGIELADSVTIDAHKWLSVPMGAGMIVLRKHKHAANVFSVQTSYMPDGDGADMYITTKQWSRRFIGLRLWMILRALGQEGYQAMFDRHFALADYLRQQLPKHDWTIRNQGKLPVIVFDDARSKLDAQTIADALEVRGNVWLGRVNFEGRSVLRACTTSFLSEQADVDLLIEELGAVRTELA